MAREAPVRSGWPSPTPPQKIFMPPPVPVDSTTGAGLPVVFENSSATAWVNGNTVDEPTILIWSRASAVPAIAAMATAVAAVSDILFTSILPDGYTVRPRRSCRQPPFV